MRISVGSGKGGVGKTFFASSMISHFSKKYKLVSMDADVDAPNLALALGVELRNRKSVSISKTAVINDSCIRCMRCVEVCNFGAARPPKIDKFLCEGCGACAYVCPVNAINIVTRKTGDILWGKTRYGYVVSAALELGRSGSGMLVDEEKKIVEKILHEENEDMVVIDVPAGIECTTISAISGSDVFVGVVEPTPQSLSDMKRMLKIVNHFGIEYYIIINKFDLDESFSKKLESVFSGRVLGKIHFDDSVPFSISKMKPLVEVSPSAIASLDALRIFEKIDDIFKLRR